MNYFILFFGVLISLGGAALIVRPEYIFGIFTKYGDSFGLHFIAVLVRFVFGVVLVSGAAESKHPILLEIFGWLLIVAALVLCVIGRERFKGLIKWSAKLSPDFQRVAAILGILLGCFLIYAVT